MIGSRTALTFLVVLVASNASAEVSRVCDLSYQLPDGSWSAPQRREVSFRTGREMAKGSPSYFGFDAQEEYAVITWSAGDLTVIELDAAFLSSGDAFTDEDFKRFFTVRSQIEAHEVNDARKRRWRIVAKEGVPPRFIDSRAQQAPH